MHSPMGIHDVGVNNMSSEARKINFSTFSDTIQMIHSIPMSIINLRVFLLVLTGTTLRSKRSHQFFLNLQISHMLLCIVIII